MAVVRAAAVRWGSHGEQLLVDSVGISTSSWPPTLAA